MILILSTPRDLDTQEVIDWLEYKKGNYFRLNDEDLMTGEVEFTFNPTQPEESYLCQNNQKLYIKDFKVVWFRKFGFLNIYEADLGKSSELVKYLYAEFNIIRGILLDLLKPKEWLFKKENMPSKLKVLEIANKCNLNIPDTLITSQKNDLEFFFNRNNKSIISKSLSEGKNLVFKDHVFPIFTQKIDSIEKIQNKFSPSLFQKYIEKIYELRIFYINGEFFPMVIFSQNNPKTKTDFRNYDLENPNRTEPYKLPKEQELKLDNLMKTVGLNTGSIDMVRGTDNNYYFLEVNPSGQFGMTGFPCNYPLHEKIADYLIEKN
jgi:ATP-GRASP peptide maturase of grasp-with-spasm system